MHRTEMLSEAITHLEKAQTLLNAAASTCESHHQARPLGSLAEQCENLKDEVRFFEDN